MPVKSISTIQAKTPIQNLTLLRLSDGPCVIFDIEGNVSSTTGTNYYIQLLGTASPVSGTTVPLYSRLVVPAAYGTGINGFSFVYRPEGLDTSKMTNPEGGSITTAGGNSLPVFVAISTTDAVFTGVAAPTNVTVELEGQGTEPAGQTVVGDLTSNIAQLTVWTDPNPTNRLVKIQAMTGAFVRYLQIFTVAPSNGMVPFLSLVLPINGVTSLIPTTYGFGSGLKVYSQDANYVLHTGCYLAISTTQNVLTLAGANSRIKAFYVTQ